MERKAGGGRRIYKKCVYVETQNPCDSRVTASYIYTLPLIAELIRNARSWAYLVTSGIFFLTLMPITAIGVITYEKKTWWKTLH